MLHNSTLAYYMSKKDYIVCSGNVQLAVMLDMSPLPCTLFSLQKQVQQGYQYIGGNQQHT